ncbi:hypothetical protein CCMA1212_008164 [Trichoderma ghanense]|uniref:Uncharacterized protein n=1 Tax=Trichoderma ghanense TaxID=65468 RepID=A0ABY2GWD3_9HYPO
MAPTQERMKNVCCVWRVGLLKITATWPANLEWLVFLRLSSFCQTCKDCRSILVEAEEDLVFYDLNEREENLGQSFVNPTNGRHVVEPVPYMQQGIYERDVPNPVIQVSPPVGWTTDKPEEAQKSYKKYQKGYIGNNAPVLLSPADLKHHSKKLAKGAFAFIGLNHEDYPDCYHAPLVDNFFRRNGDATALGFSIGKNSYRKGSS